MGFFDKKIEKKVDFFLIVKVTGVNSVYLFITFLLLLSTMADFALALIYSLIAQIISLIGNGLFWVRWVFMNLPISKDAKLGLSTLVVVSLMTGIIFLASLASALSLFIF